MSAQKIKQGIFVLEIGDSIIPLQQALPGAGPISRDELREHLPEDMNADTTAVITLARNSKEIKPISQYAPITKHNTKEATDATPVSKTEG